MSKKAILFIHTLSVTVTLPVVERHGTMLDSTFCLIRLSALFIFLDLSRRHWVNGALLPAPDGRFRSEDRLPHLLDSSLEGNKRCIAERLGILSVGKASKMHINYVANFLQNLLLGKLRCSPLSSDQNMFQIAFLPSE